MSRKLRALAEFIPKKPVPFFLLGSFLFLYFRTFIFPHVPIYQGDNAPLFLSEAGRMLHGQEIYRDFFELTFPGTQLVYLILFKVLGVRAWIPAAVLVLAGVALVWLGIVVSSRLVSGASVFLPSL